MLKVKVPDVRSSIVTMYTRYNGHAILTISHSIAALRLATVIVPMTTGVQVTLQTQPSLYHRIASTKKKKKDKTVQQ